MSLVDTIQSPGTESPPSVWRRVGRYLLHTLLVLSSITYCLLIALFLFLCFVLDVELGAEGAWAVIIATCIFLAMIVLTASALGVLPKNGEVMGTYATIMMGIPTLIGWHAIFTCIVILVRG